MKIESEDCMGRPSVYFSVSRWCSDGKEVLGCGETHEAASQVAEDRVKAHEAYLSADLMGKLKILTSGDLLDTDQRAAIRIISQILLHNKGVIE